MSSDPLTVAASADSFTLSHWGVQEVHREGKDRFSLRPWRDDPDPSAVGLDLGSDAVDALRVRKPAFRAGWLQDRKLSRMTRGHDRFVELAWPEAVEIVAQLDTIDAAQVKRYAARVIAGANIANGPTIAAVGPVGKLESHGKFASRFGAAAVISDAAE